MVDMTEILVHWHAGWSLSEIAESLGVDRKTVRKYVAPAIAAGLAPGGPAKSTSSGASWCGLGPSLADTRLRQITWPQIEVHWWWVGCRVPMKVAISGSMLHRALQCPDLSCMSACGRVACDREECWLA